jgi:hypothetical protein
VQELRAVGTRTTPLNSTSLANNWKCVSKDSTTRGLYRYHFFSCGRGNFIILSTCPATSTTSGTETSRHRDRRPQWLPTRLFGNTSVCERGSSVELDQRWKADQACRPKFLLIQDSDAQQPKADQFLPQRVQCHGAMQSTILPSGEQPICLCEAASG